MWSWTKALFLIDKATDCSPNLLAREMLSTQGGMEDLIKEEYAGGDSRRAIEWHPSPPALGSCRQLRCS
jgi:hypothetical protein